MATAGPPSWIDTTRSPTSTRTTTKVESRSAPKERQSDHRDEVERSESTRRPARGEQEEGHRDDIERSGKKQRADARRDSHEQKRYHQHEESRADPEQRERCPAPAARSR